MTHTNQLQNGYGQTRILIAAIVFLLWGSEASADRLWTTRGQVVVEVSHVVTASVEDGVVTMKVQRTFLNRGSTPEQVEMIIGLPEDMVATGLRIRTGNQWYNGDLMEARMAATAYQYLTGSGPFPLKDPALLSWWNDAELMLRVFPVVPGRMNTVEYTLKAPVKYRNGQEYFVYHSKVEQVELARPQLVFSKVPPGRTVQVNGRFLPVQNAHLLEPSEQIGEVCAPELDENGEEERNCAAPEETLIAVASEDFPDIRSRLGVFSLNSGRAVVSFDLALAKELREMPKNARVVFVVDGSHTFDAAGISAALNYCRSFARQAPGARFEVVLFRRKAQRLFGQFVPADRFDQTVKKNEAETAPGNGSNLEAGLLLAAEILKNHRGEQRIVALSDMRFRTRFENERAVAAMNALDSKAIVHLAYFYPGSQGDSVNWYRSDDHERAPIIHNRRGVFAVIEGGETPEDYRRSALEFIRPQRIDDLSVSLGENDAALPILEYDETVGRKGGAFHFMEVQDSLFERAVIKGKIWGEDISHVVSPDVNYSQSVLPALVFGGDTYSALNEDEMMLAAIAGRAVTPQTSYLAIEPGVRPSVQGIEENSGRGGSGTGEGTVGFGSLGGRRGGTGGKIQTEHLVAALRAAAEQAASRCNISTGSDTGLSIRFETTLNEIVDIEILTIRDKDRLVCIEDELWNASLPDAFAKFNTFTTDIRM